MSFAPGDLAVTFTPPGVDIVWGDIRPGLVGVVLSFPYTAPPRPDSAGRWSDVVDIRFPHLTTICATGCLKKIQPPPEEEITLTEEELTV